MSKENVELARRSIEALNRRDHDAYLALMADDVQAAPRLTAIEGGYRGHNGFISGGRCCSKLGRTSPPE